MKLLSATLLSLALISTSALAKPNNARSFYSHSKAVSTNTKTKVKTTALIKEGKKYIGGNPTGRNRLWCADFMNFILKRSGYKTTHSRLAKSFLHYDGKKLRKPVVGAIAVVSRRGGGHVGVVVSITKSGDPVLLSGNHNRKVAIARYPKNRVIAYIVPIPVHG